MLSEQLSVKLAQLDPCSMNSKLAEQYYRRADELCREGKTEEALPLLNILDDAFPEQKNIQYARAHCLASLGRTDDARALCERLIQAHDSVRARRLLTQLDGGAVALGEDVLGLNEPVFAGIPVSVRPRPKRAIPLRAIALVLLGLPLVVTALLFRYQTVNPSTSSGAISKEDVAQAAAARHEKKLAQAEGPVTRAGTVHPEDVWRLTAIGGIPDWKPGIYKDVPCVGAPHRTISVYVPMAYQERPEDLFPTLAISMPGGNPGFLGLRDWAERREVILIAINSSRNGGWRNNWEAQNAAIDTVLPHMRIDQRLGFAVGVSGGAQASWRLAARLPSNYAGVVMEAQGGYSDKPLSLNTRVAYLNGNRDWNHDYINKMEALLKRNGYTVRRQVYNGGHGNAPVPLRIKMLDWMLAAARRDLGIDANVTANAAAIRPR